MLKIKLRVKLHHYHVWCPKTAIITALVKIAQFSGYSSSAIFWAENYESKFKEFDAISTFWLVLHTSKLIEESSKLEKSEGHAPWGAKIISQIYEAWGESKISTIFLLQPELPDCQAKIAG